MGVQPAVGQDDENRVTEGLQVSLLCVPNRHLNLLVQQPDGTPK